MGKSVQCVHSLLHVLDNVVTNNTSQRTAACRLIAYNLCAYLQPLRGQDVVCDRFGLAQPHEYISKAATYHANSTVQAASNNNYNIVTSLVV